MRVGVGAAEVVLYQLLCPLMAQFETYRSEADLIVADEDLWAGTSAAPASAAKQPEPLQPRVRTPRLWARHERWIWPPRRICVEKTSRRPACAQRNHDRRKGVTDLGDSIAWAFA